MSRRTDVLSGNRYIPRWERDMIANEKRLEEQWKTDSEERRRMRQLELERQAKEQKQLKEYYENEMEDIKLKINKLAEGSVAYQRWLKREKELERREKELETEQKIFDNENQLKHQMDKKNQIHVHTNTINPMKTEETNNNNKGSWWKNSFDPYTSKDSEDKKAIQKKEQDAYNEKESKARNNRTIRELRNL